MQPLTTATLFAAALSMLAFVPVTLRAQATYSLKAVEANPIPKAENFLLWKELALRACSDSKARFNLGESACLAVISQRADSCASQLSNESPAPISTTAVARDVGRKYLHCATAFYFCKGTEVRNEAEVRAKCQ